LETFIYDLRFEHDATEWRASARRDTVIAMWRRFAPELCHGDAGRRVLDVGCGTGVGMADYAEFGEVAGIDASEAAVRYAYRRDMRRAGVADASSLPFRSGIFSLVSMIEVLEHVEDDEGALAELARVTVPGGLIVLTVPAFQWLWSVRDVHLHHKRRYRLPDLTAKVARAGLEMKWCTYFDLFLLAPLAAMVGYAKVRGDSRHLEQYGLSTSVTMNSLWKGVSATERAFYSRVRFPLGVSILCVVQRPHSR
jgi:SAM-dependent methyltransferase